MATNKQYHFVCRNPQKYAGDARRIIVRSTWELAYCQALDNSNMVLKWISEPRNLNISYVSPIDKKVHQYWPDFLVQYVGGEIELLEIKPKKEALAENAKSLYDKLSLIKNIAKWKAGDNFAKSIGGRFRVITEDQLFRRKSTRQTNRTRSTTRTRGTSK